MEVRLKEKIPGVFWPVHQAIRRGEVTEVVAKGGRGSGKSSYLSMELVWQLLRHPDCHAVVLRKVAGTMRASVYAQITWAIGALIIGDYYTALGLFVIYLVTVTVRQIIEPRIVGKQLGLYPLVTMMSMFAGFQIMGTLGLIAGPLVANICKVTLDADAGKLEPGTQKSVLPWSRLWDSLRRKNKKSK